MGFQYFVKRCLLLQRSCCATKFQDTPSASTVTTNPSDELAPSFISSTIQKYETWGRCSSTQVHSKAPGPGHSSAYLMPPLTDPGKQAQL